jgi:hypothetical protein
MQAEGRGGMDVHAKGVDGLVNFEKNLDKRVERGNIEDWNDGSTLARSKCVESMG